MADALITRNVVFAVAAPVGSNILAAARAARDAAAGFAGQAGTAGATAGAAAGAASGATAGASAGTAAGATAGTSAGTTAGAAAGATSGASAGTSAATALLTGRSITAGAGLTGGGTLAADRSIALSAASVASLALADTSIQPARIISAGAGLVGGGSLATDLSLSLSAGSVASLASAGSAVQPARSISTQYSLTGGGSLAADRTLSLVNDAATPGNSKFYGTDASGLRGWFNQFLPAALADGAVGTPSLAYASEPGLGLYRIGAATLGFAALGSVAFSVQGVSSAVNYLQARPSIAGAPISLLATGSDTNISLAIGPKGTGALQAQVNDAAITGGNARGANAVDWQTVRTVSTQAATGAQATISGGANSTASGANSSVGGGTTNLALAASSTIAGGATNTTSGTNSWIPGGREAFDRGNFGRGTWSAGRFATNGDAQAGEFVLRRITTDATVTRLTADNAAPGTTNTVNLPNNGGYALKLMVRAYQTVGTTIGDGATFDCTVQFTRITNAAGTTFDGGYFVAPTTFANTAIVAGTGFAPCFAKGGGTAWRFIVDVDTTNGSPAFSIVGEASKTIRTAVRVLSIEVTA